MCKNEQSVITPKLDKTVFRFFSIAVLSNEIYLHTKFHVLELCPGQKSKSKNKQRAITSK
jgi:hypothetical protein